MRFNVQGKILSLLRIGVRDLKNISKTGNQTTHEDEIVVRMRYGGGVRFYFGYVVAIVVVCLL